MFVLEWLFGLEQELLELLELVEPQGNGHVVVVHAAVRGVQVDGVVERPVVELLRKEEVLVAVLFPVLVVVAPDQPALAALAFHVADAAL